jgi:hypothetical protein
MDQGERGGKVDRLERIEEALEELKSRLRPGGKDRWDKAEVIVGAAGSLLIPLAVLLAGTYFSNALAEAQMESEERRDEASIAIAEGSMHVSQAQLIATFMKPLLSPDGPERKLAIRAVLLALPAAGPELVKVIEESATDPQIQQAAAAALAARREELVKSVYAGDQGVQERAADSLVLGFRHDPLLVEAIAREAQGKTDNTTGLYNSARVLRAVPAEELLKKRAAVQRFTRIARRGGARAQVAAEEIDKKAEAAATKTEGADK